MSSPSWYRRRSAVFALIYFAGFFGGWLISPAHRYVPAFQTLGHYLGSNGATILLLIAVLFTVACLAIRAWGSSYLSAAVVWNANAKTDMLVVAGPFRYMRHPLYFGNMLLAVGFGLLAPVMGFAFIFIANAAFIALLIGHEESLMLRRFGDVYRAYFAQVPALFPRLVPVQSQTTLQPSMTQGILSEAFTAALAAGLFAWILVPTYGVYCFVLLYVAGVLAQRAIDQRSS